MNVTNFVFMLEVVCDDCDIVLFGKYVVAPLRAESTFGLNQFKIVGFGLYRSRV
jgi:hypothetical protein